MAWVSEPDQSCFGAGGQFHWGAEEVADEGDHEEEDCELWEAEVEVHEDVVGDVVVSLMAAVEAHSQDEWVAVALLEVRADALQVEGRHKQQGEPK